MPKADKRLYFRFPEQKLKILEFLLFCNAHKEIGRSLGNPTLLLKPYQFCYRERSRFALTLIDRTLTTPTKCKQR
ncbi:MAG: hypothetical protein ACYTXI_06310 [Nostoc sp.]